MALTKPNTGRELSGKIVWRQILLSKMPDAYDDDGAIGDPEN
ncbi:hypothetical protein [Planctomicrobium sp. SH664]